MPMYYFLKYSQIYSMISRTFWSYYRYETDDVDDIASGNKSFIFKTKITEKQEARPVGPAQPGPDEHGNQPSPENQHLEILIDCLYFLQNDNLKVMIILQ